MRTVGGKVRRVRHTISTGGPGWAYNGYVTTSHIAILELDGGVQVRYESGEPAMISEGDELIFAGRMSRAGFFIANSYRNLSNHVSDNNGIHWLAIVSGLILAVSGPIVGVRLSLPEDILQACLMIALSIFGLGLVTYGMRMIRMNSMVNR